MEMDLEVVPVLNRLYCRPPIGRVAEEIEDIVGIDATDAVRCSAKTGVGVTDVLERWCAISRRRKAIRTARCESVIDSGSITARAWYRWCVLKRHHA